MFRMSPAVEWLERDYDTVTRLTWTPYAKGHPYHGNLRHFEARWHWEHTDNPHVGPMFSWKIDRAGQGAMQWDPDFRPDDDDEVPW